MLVPHVAMLVMFGFGVRDEVPGWISIFFGVALIIYLVALLDFG